MYMKKLLLLLILLSVISLPVYADEMIIEVDEPAAASEVVPADDGIIMVSLDDTTVERLVEQSYNANLPLFVGIIASNGCVFGAVLLKHFNFWGAK